VFPQRHRLLVATFGKPNGDGWGGVIINRWTETRVFVKGWYAAAEAAKSLVQDMTDDNVQGPRISGWPGGSDSSAGNRAR
jgi:hypothetical protein